MAVCRFPFSSCQVTVICRFIQSLSSAETTGSDDRSRSTAAMHAMLFFRSSIIFIFISVFLPVLI